MNLLRIAAVATACTGVAAAQDLNRLDLHNGQDVLWILNAPYQGAPVDNFDPTGDLYWKAFPADVLQRCDGDSNLMGINAVMFDSDFAASEALWAYTITTGTIGTDTTILPTQTGAGVFVPGTSTSGTIFGDPGCPGPGYLAGWIYSETFLDSATSLPTPLLDMTTDGATDWVFTHYFPAPGIADMDPVTGPINSCGTTGDFTLQWGGSTDGFGALGNGGENQPDFTGFGNSRYSGFNLGGAGTFAPISEGADDAPQLSFYFDEATLNGRVDTNNGDGFVGPELGLAGIETPLQISSGGVPAGDTTFLGLRVYEQGANTTGSDIALFSVNVGPTFLDLTGGCLDLAGAPLALNPADPGFSIALTAMGLPGYQIDPDGPNPTSAFADSNQVPAGTGPAWVNLELSWQAWRISLVSGNGESGSQVFKQTLRFNDGV